MNYVFLYGLYGQLTNIFDQLKDIICDQLKDIICDQFIDKNVFLRFYETTRHK